MEVQYFGANCIRLATKKAVIVVDDNLAELGQKTITKSGDIALFTGPHGVPTAEVKLLFDQPGEYEVSDISVQGIPTRSHIDEEGKHSATMFKLAGEDIRIAVLGHVYPDLNDEQLEALGMVDVLFVPVGGMGFTLDSIGALKLIKKIEPKIVIPTHYADQGLNYPVPQQSLEEALKELAMEAHEPVAKLKLKPGEFTDATQLIVLEKQ